METDRNLALERATQARALRGMILTILHRSIGRPTMMRIVEQAVLSAGGSHADAQEQVFYLTSKGYVQLKGESQHKVPGIGDVVEITAAGIDVVEGTTEDPGVVF
jgi:hypothetical protein